MQYNDDITLRYKTKKKKRENVPIHEIALKILMKISSIYRN